MENELIKRDNVHEQLLATVSEHGTFTSSDEDALRRVQSRLKSLRPGEDVVCQGDRPDTAVLLLRGTLARYHTLASGDRQFLSFHIRGDMPDAQSLFLDVMDHSLCALDAAEIAMLPHDQLQALCVAHPAISFALWRMTLVDAAIFRQAITNNGVRGHVERLAHILCEMYYRLREAGLARGSECDLPLTQAQLGQALGMAAISINRALSTIRNRHFALVKGRRLTVLDWSGLTELAGFDPTYLHCAKGEAVRKAPFWRGR